MSGKRTQNTNPEVVGQQKFSTNYPKKSLSDWSVCLPRQLFSPKIASFYQKNHSDGNYIFWPDQKGCHYAEHSLDFLCENLIHHVDKVDNPANLPEVRPKEDFWSILKAQVYENN